VGNLVQSSNGQAADPGAASSKRGPDDKPKSIKDEVSLLSVDYISKFRENLSQMVEQYLSQLNNSKFTNAVKCNVGHILKHGSESDYEKWKSLESAGKERKRKRKLQIVENTISAIIGGQVLCGNVSNSKISYSSVTVQDVFPRKPSESIKGRRAKFYIDSLRKAASSSTVVFVIDVDNVGHISSILEFLTDWMFGSHFL
jgi:hypothetical protein